MTNGNSATPGTPSATTPSLLGIRKSIDSLTADELAALRSGITKMLAISDDRGYEYWAGIHGLPLPISCWHGSPIFLPWHRAYLYYFEQYLMDQESTARLPWWDWADDQAIPDAYAQPTLPDGSGNQLAGAPITGIPAGQFTEFNIPQATQTSRQPAVGNSDTSLPSSDDVTAVLQLDTFADFTAQLEQLHNNVHVWVGGTMAMIPLAAYDPLFWAHHTMIDRIWSLWQQANPGAGAGTLSLTSTFRGLPGLNVGQVLRFTASITPRPASRAACSSTIPTPRRRRLPMTRTAMPVPSGCSATADARATKDTATCRPAAARSITDPSTS
jgi:tyrosinase